MAQETLEPKTLEIPEEGIATSSSSEHRSPAESVDPSLSRNVSFSRLNAGAAEFVPRAAPPAANPHGSNRVKIHHGAVHHHHPPPPVIHVFHPPPPVSPQFVAPPPVSPQFVAPAPNHGMFEYYGVGGGGRGGGFGELDVAQAPVDLDPAPPPAREGLSDDAFQKITKQVEYYFSDANLATTEHLMRFITKDPEGFVPISVIASFKKIKALVHNNSLLASALRTSTKLEVSDDGKKVRRQQPFTESDVEELQSRIVVAENLPEDHCYQSLMKVFSVVGSVKTIRTCYPQTPNGTASATNRSSKMDMLFCNKLHAFVEYETVEDAEKAVTELNDERNWRSGLRVRLLHSCMTKHGPGRGRKSGHEDEGNGEEDAASTTNQPKVKQVEDPSQSTEASVEHVGEEGINDKDGGAARRGKGRGRGGGKGRGRGHYHNNSNNNNNNHHRSGGGHAVGTPPSSHPIHSEQPAVIKQPPGPRMPDGTRGFTMGRGKPHPPSTSTGC